MPCEVVADRLPEVAAGRLLLDAESRGHLDSCLRCQVQVVHYRRILRSLAAMRDEVVDPGQSFVDQVLEAVEAAGERGALHDLLSDRRFAYAGGLAAAAAAAAAGGAIAFAARSRWRVGLAG